MERGKIDRTMNWNLHLGYLPYIPDDKDSGMCVRSRTGIHLT